MPAMRSVQFYEELMETAMKERMIKFSDTYTRYLGIPVHELAATPSIFSLSERYKLPDDVTNFLISEAITVLMKDYNANGTGVPPRTQLKTFSKKDKLHDQCKIAKKILLTTEQWNLQSESSFLDRIKGLLEEGLFANKRHPQDNFPNIVHAIVNKTAWMEGWQFSEKVNQEFGVGPAYNTSGPAVN